MVPLVEEHLASGVLVRMGNGVTVGVSVDTTTTVDTRVGTTVIDTLEACAEVHACKNKEISSINEKKFADLQYIVEQFLIFI